MRSPLPETSRATRLCALAALALLLGGTAPLSAGWLNEAGRHLGLGWSDGYHAYEGCPDPRLRSQPWQRRASRSGAHDEPLVPYLQPLPVPTPAPQPAPEPLPVPKTGGKSSPGSKARTSQLHISRPHY